MKVQLSSLREKQDEEASLFVSGKFNDDEDDDDDGEGGDGESEDDDNEAAFDEASHSRLLNNLMKMKRTNKRIDGQREVRTSLGSGVVKVDASHLIKRIGSASLDRSAAKLQSLPVPLEKTVARKAKRAAGFEKVATESQVWAPIVDKHRRLETVHFPLQQPDLRPKEVEKAEERIRVPKTKLEKEVYELLHGSQLVKKVETEEELAAKKALSLQEVREKNQELWRQKELQRRYEHKAMLQNKSKSRKYHKILRRDKLKKQRRDVEELERKDPEAALDLLKELEQARIQERMSLRHKKSKWAIFQGPRATKDNQVMAALKENQRIHRELVEKTAKKEEEEEEEEVYTSAMKIAMQYMAKQAAIERGTYDPLNPWTSTLKQQGGGGGDGALSVMEEEEEVEFVKFWKEFNKRKEAERKIVKEMEEKEKIKEVEEEKMKEVEEKEKMKEVKEKEKEKMIKEMEEEGEKTETGEEEMEEVDGGKKKVEEIDVVKLKGKKKDGMKLKGKKKMCEEESSMEEKDGVKLKGKKKDGVKLKGKKNDDVKLKGKKMCEEETSMEKKDGVKLKGKKNDDVKLKGKKNDDVKLKGQKKMCEEETEMDPKMKKKNVGMELKVKKNDGGKLKGKKKKCEEETSTESPPHRKDGPKSVPLSKDGPKSAPLSKDGPKSVQLSKEGSESAPQRLKQEQQPKPDDEEENVDSTIDAMFDEAEEGIKRNIKRKLNTLYKEINDVQQPPLNTKRTRTSNVKASEPVRVQEYDFTSKHNVENLDERHEPLNSNSGSGEQLDSKSRLQSAADVLKRGEQPCDKANTGQQTQGRKNPTKNTVDVDPTNFLQVTPKRLLTSMPDTVKGGGEEGLDGDEDNDDEDPEEDPEAIIREAFADDYLIDEFKSEKAAAIASSGPKVKSLALPGWGEWTGPNIKMSKRKFNRFKVRVPKMKRKDSNLGNVIYNEDADVHDNLRKVMVSDLPYPFKSVKDFEASVRAPVGRMFIPEAAHQRMTQPALTTKMGTVIEPMTEDELLKRKKGRITDNKKDKRGGGGDRGRGKERSRFVDIKGQ
ncbi:hypothetical protein Pmani_002837 [Petrolisthes manimaculis]|uniref:U3 small nucleolar RNA-associated protein 14 n=1 Tax=Petrolisthes manimaculis TaxID=1843537 RepID=A0AAE1QGU3_9EUCA|nr:hypothetical protein Pmani_002837 [Petrolisthes manimaculis]